MNSSPKPNGAQLGWHLLETTYPFQREIVKIREDRVRLREKELSYAYMERSGAVVVVPVTADGRMILIRQYRYPVDEWCLEVPAGGTHDTGDSTLEEVARRELKEEAGAHCRELRSITHFYSANSLSDEKCHVYLALGVELDGGQQTEQTEDIEIHMVTVEEALRLAHTGQIRTGPCALAILLCEDTLRQLGFLQAR